MNDSLFKNVVNSMIDNGAIKKEDEEIYVFGLKMVVALTINIATTLLLGAVMGMLLNSIVLLLVIVPIRSYAGGIHASSYIKCYIYSVLILIIMFSINKYYLYNNVEIVIIGIVIAWLIIYTVAPITSKNKPVTKEEYIKYRNISRIISTVYCVIGVVLYAFGSEYSVDVFSGMILCAMSMLIGKVKKI